MAKLGDLFFRANYRCHQRAYQRWHQSQRKRQILRSQIGFAEMSTSRPAACVGCANYHGHAYGTQKSKRTPLVCAIHPYGWPAGNACPDWRGEDKPPTRFPLKNIRTFIQ
ncbi:MAG: hypothetical protein F6K00_01890 [Leptolyngbya sp. SIOISBB]|nr:hypothetical protein [Leptolyngbya sp. SIOISBB]